jgi:hypothetical protein
MARDLLLKTIKLSEKGDENAKRQLPIYVAKFKDLCNKIKSLKLELVETQELKVQVKKEFKIYLKYIQGNASMSSVINTLQ